MSGSSLPSPRFIVLLDESCLLVFPSVEAAVFEIEAIDVENELRAAFDETGVPYRVEWIRPNRHGWFSVTNGEYRFVPAGPRDPAALLALIAAYPSARSAAGQTVDVAELTRGVRAG